MEPGDDSVQSESDAWRRSRGSDAEPVALLGIGRHLEHQDQRAQQRDRSEGADVEYLRYAHYRRGAGLLQSGIGSSICEADAGWSWRQTADRLRSEDQTVRD